jgi:sugar transferase (PEP-CTERM/EpsH1 system associated)
MVNTLPRISALVITGRLPWPVDDGWKMRTYNIIRGLAASGITVELATFVDPDESSATVAALGNLCTAVYPVVRSRRYRPGDLVKGVLGRIPFSVHNYSVREMHETIARLGRDHAYDLVMVEDIVMAPYAQNLTASVKFLDMHNVESHLLVRYAEQERQVGRKVYAAMTAGKLARFEKKAAFWFDGIFVCSSEDKKKLEKMGVTTRIEVMPNGINPELYVRSDEETEDGSIVFVGSMDYHANISGVRYFVSQILPLVLTEKPDLKFYIVGKNPSSEVQSLANRNVIVTGSVPDVRPYLARAAVVVVPLLVGGGTRLKILEAMAMGKAVVSTSLGCEGLSVSHHDTILVGDCPADFAGWVLRLLDDSALAKSIGLRGRAMVEMNYDWNVITSDIKQLYEQRVNARNR